MTREELIVEFYENGRIPFVIKLIDFIKGEKNEYSNNRRMDTNRNNTVSNNGNSSTWFSSVHKKINNEEIKNE